MDLTVSQALLVLPDREVVGDVVVRDGVIAEVAPRASRPAGEVVDGRGLVLLPGAVDAQVHFRDPGLTHKEDLESGSRAAAAGGVTAYLEMPNTRPSTTTRGALAAKLARAAQVSSVHYGFFVGATKDNVDELVAADETCGIKVFMGASTGDLLVDDADALDAILARSGDRIVAVHAEDEARLRGRRAAYTGHDVADHARIRDEEAAMIATKTAVGLARRHGARLHVLHVSTAEEADWLATLGDPRITAEVCTPHLFLDAETAYEALGTKAQCNPPVRARRHREALWRHLHAGTFALVATDHAPHTLEEKGRTYPESPSGMPGVEWMLPLLCEEVAAGRATWSDVARWVCDGPARTYGLRGKGRLEVGFDGDLALVDPGARRTIGDRPYFTRCGWSPFEGRVVRGWPVLTAVDGRPVFRDGEVLPGVRGRSLFAQPQQ